MINDLSKIKYIKHKRCVISIFIYLIRYFKSINSTYCSELWSDDGFTSGAKINK